MFSDHGVLNFQKESLKVNSLRDTTLKCIHISEGQSQYFYIPGYMTKDTRFYKCPLISMYTQLNRIVIKKIMSPTHNHLNGVPNSDEIIIDLNIYSKDFSTCRHNLIYINRSGYQIVDHGISLVPKAINFINKHIDKYGSADDLNIEKIKYNTFDDLKMHQISYSINKLKFDYFENSMNNPGKDNSFWMETEISNLPDDVYLLDIFFKILSKNCRYIYRKENCIILHSDTEKAWSPSFPRRKAEGEYSGQHYKDILHYEIASIISPHEVIFSRIRRVSSDI